MQVNNIYPILNKQTRQFIRIRNIVRIIFLVAAIACGVVNIATATRPWSVVVAWSLWSLWNLIFSPDIIEFNLISQTVKLAFYVTVLLLLIDKCIAPGWAMFVVPIVVFAFIIAAAVFFLMDIRAQIQNSMPLIWMVVASLIGALVSMKLMDEKRWPVITMAAVAFATLLVLIFFHQEVRRELRKRFHTNGKKDNI